jgi:hypothetical protein
LFLHSWVPRPYEGRLRVDYLQRSPSASSPPRLRLPRTTIALGASEAEAYCSPPTPRILSAAGPARLYPLGACGVPFGARALSRPRPRGPERREVGPRRVSPTLRASAWQQRAGLGREDPHRHGPVCRHDASLALLSPPNAETTQVTRLSRGPPHESEVAGLPTRPIRPPGSKKSTRGTVQRAVSRIGAGANGRGEPER